MARFATMIATVCVWIVALGHPHRRVTAFMLTKINIVAWKETASFRMNFMMMTRISSVVFVDYILLEQHLHSPFSIGVDGVKLDTRSSVQNRRIGNI